MKYDGLHGMMLLKMSVIQSLHYLGFSKSQKIRMEENYINS
jgi:hypothetical protein